MAERLSFRWSYIIAPLVVFLLSVILAACFYHLLPAEVAVRFELDGTPNMWLGRGLTMVWVLAPQLFLVLLAGGVAWGVTRFNILPEQGKKTVSLMGNVVALPQLIVLFAMLDILSYNSYQTHILPMWIFLLAILGLATVALGVFAIFVILRARRAMSQPDEKGG